MSLVQVLIRRHMRPAYPGAEPHELIYDWRVDAQYVPEDLGDRDNPPTDEGFDINAVYSPTGVPLVLSRQQLQEVEEIMLDNVHMQQEDERS